ncbi:GH32 C-terminal domain-containing protein [Nocardioides nematodiphilus]|uniref:GH32 C-terminal domain-containing protein n=1 Tax=Nocardioides nematodiphilus TaxID=2849669 RepID=UPI001CD9528C|nr:GH32 C-terminal domain-containing protein [Nocardioides nematodiphilus]MCA1982183.1 GH32 C-terminal domain-containing protein [Nocardioides nematodiphilus]
MTTRKRLLASAAALAAATCGISFSTLVPAQAAKQAPAVTATAPATADTRPNYHYTPERNWMNDPNGLIHYGGRYHLFYQYNATGNTGGNASWGHAVSTDLVHWKQLPIAIPSDADEEVWSGSVVYDKSNTSGLGTGRKGPLVAVYTSAPRATGIQRQSIAYSTDDGTTWTKYAANPVLDIGSHNFRDPKVFWYAPAKQWRMVVALSDQHKVAIYGSPDLKNWSQLSEFGPDGVTSAVWEVPDLFPLQLDGDAGQTRWIMTVNVAGKAEYFVGSFDGTTFTDSEPPYVAPAGTTLADFEGSTYGSGWTTTGSAFGDGPVRDTGAAGYAGSGYVDTFHTSDAETGTLTSPSFTVDKNYLNFLIGGGRHPYVEGGSTAAPAGETFQDFEGDSLPGWTGTGDLAGAGPSHESLAGQLGHGVLDTCQGGCDAAQGTLTSPTFTIAHPYIDLLTAGGQHPWGQAGPTAVNLVVDGDVVASVTGNNSGAMDWVHLDASKYIGRDATLEVVDQSDGSTGWGHMMIDNIVFADTVAGPWNTETGANLIVDGKVVRTATGNDSGALDWASWDLRDLQGKQAQLQLVDRNTGGWGHLIADQFMMADQAARSTSERAHWLDDGRDFYAAVTFNDAPAGQRIVLGWLNNWDYANTIPTDGWRGTQSIPRVLSLRTVDGQPRIVQRPVPQLERIAVARGARHVRPIVIPSGTKVLTENTGDNAVRVDAVIDAGSATTFGLQLLRSADGTRYLGVSYDTATGRLTVDRTHAGDVGFNAAFPSVDGAVVPLSDGRLRLELYLDKTSIEAFAQHGRTAITDLVFPHAGDNAIALTASGGTARLERLSVTPLADAMAQAYTN